MRSTEWHGDDVCLTQRHSRHPLLRRLAALKLLADSGIVNKDRNYVLVEVFPLQKEAEVGWLMCGYGVFALD